MSYPCPPCCGGSFGCPRCTFDNRPSEWIADLTGFAMVDRFCDYCDQVTGEYTMAFASTACVWEFSDPDVCRSGGGQTDLSVSLGYTNVGSTAWKLLALATLNNLSGGHTSVWYETTGTTDSNCWFFGGQGSTDKVTLDYQSDVSIGTAWPCSTTPGTPYPATITTWAP